MAELQIKPRKLNLYWLHMKLMPSLIETQMKMVEQITSNNSMSTCMLNTLILHILY